MPIEGQAPELARIAEQLTQENFGIGLAEAQAKGICIACKEPALPKCYSEAGRKEYNISGMCERCFDEAFEEHGLDAADNAPDSQEEQGDDLEGVPV